VSATAHLDRDLDLAELDAQVERAIRLGKPDGLRVLGYGEFSLVLGWPAAEPLLAVKRLPPFRDELQLERYRELLDRYVGALRERGVRAVPTQVRRGGAGSAGLHVYLVQPLVPRDELLNVVLRKAEPDHAAGLLDDLVAIVMRSVDERVGLDAQAANWVVDGPALATVDVSTPLMRDAGGRDAIELELFLSIYPWAVRPALERIAPSVMGQYFEARTVLVDFASNLIKERLERRLPALLRAANERVEPPISEHEVRRYFVRDRRFWLLMQWLRRADRAWQRQVRRRPYPFVLPPPYHYGPPEIDEPRREP
jgi:hypothetical protein